MKKNDTLQRHYSTRYGIIYLQQILKGGNHMEEQQEKLLKKLEIEGLLIAKYRKRLLEIARSGQKINCSKMMQICNNLNKHISSFDKISEQLITLESIS